MKGGADIIETNTFVDTRRLSLGSSFRVISNFPPKMMGAKVKKERLVGLHCVQVVKQVEQPKLGVRHE